MDRYSPPSRASGSLKPILVVAIAAFLLGALVVGYFAWTSGFRFGWGDASDVVEQPAEATPEPQPILAPTPTPSPTASAAASDTAERVAEQQGGIDQRLAAAEQRLSRLDLQAQAAAGNAARAEGLLIAFAARRSLDRGADLGYLADQLRLRFGDAKPNSVETIIAFSRNPITVDVLVARLEGLAPELTEATDDPLIERLGNELSQLFVIRRETTPSPRPERRIERARFFLESGRVNKAIEEVRNLPGAEQAKRWIADAERYVAAQRALDLIETSAVLEPRRLRDGAGNTITQPSPASSAAEEQ
ncbi:MICOS complex subunit MIC60 [Pelagerythrobacter aerophilus]|uniref:Uncharacterized protein n=1 Tax=Pelagerythrobacter aerophilus TaxID=2306995 RepID=A0A418NFX1_9SPHN|nr:hypothetical protein [Pelagerythrobacter aerophilus]RIV76807.1 hypothetical protein D2V04_11640 [Pelagerythrobacter aerophilus]